jgi:hypothetical protein
MGAFLQSAILKKTRMITSAFTIEKGSGSSFALDKQGRLNILLALKIEPSQPVYRPFLCRSISAFEPDNLANNTNNAAPER